MGKKKGKVETPQKLSGLSPPVYALVIQGVAFCLTLFLLYIINIRLGAPVSFFSLALIQGSIAGIISCFRRLPPWWLPIQFLFPIAVVFFLSLQISPVWFFIGFVILLIIYWGVVVTRVPLYLSSQELWMQVEQLLPVERPVRFIDIGSGLGGLVLHLAKNRPDSHFLGVEIAPLPWLLSRIRQLLTQSQGKFLYANYERFSLAEYDVVFAYLSPVAMDALWIKVQAEMRPGTLFLSYEFPVLSVEPDIMLPVGNAILYGWQR